MIDVQEGLRSDCMLKLETLRSVTRMVTLEMEKYRGFATIDESRNGILREYEKENFVYNSYWVEGKPSQIRQKY